MVGNDDTRRRILDATLGTLARTGPHRLSVSEVCARAGISRGTLYHYFSGKDGLLRAVGDHVAGIFQEALFAGVAARPDPEIRLEVVVESLAAVGRRHPEAMQLLIAEPAFGMDFLRQIFPEFVGILQQLLVPAVEVNRAGSAMELSSAELAELIVRMIMSAYLIPASDDTAPDTAASSVDFLSEFSAELLLMVGSSEKTLNGRT